VDDGAVDDGAVDDGWRSGGDLVWPAVGASISSSTRASSPATTDSIERMFYVVYR
jgi:hypothetical protein